MQSHLAHRRAQRGSSDVLPHSRARPPDLWPHRTRSSPPGLLDMLGTNEILLLPHRHLVGIDVARDMNMMDRWATAAPCRSARSHSPPYICRRTPAWHVRRSFSTWVVYADALRRISLPCWNSPCSRFSAFFICCRPSPAGAKDIVAFRSRRTHRRRHLHAVTDSVRKSSASPPTIPACAPVGQSARTAPNGTASMISWLP